MRYMIFVEGFAHALEFDNKEDRAAAAMSLSNGGLVQVYGGFWENTGQLWGSESPISLKFGCRDETQNEYRCEDCRLVFREDLVQTVPVPKVWAQDDSRTFYSTQTCLCVACLCDRLDANRQWEEKHPDEQIFNQETGELEDRPARPAEPTAAAESSEDKPVQPAT